MGASACDVGHPLLSWEVRPGLGWTMAEGVNGVSPSLGLETINIVSFHERNDLYQSTCSEFRYGDGKVLGTQPVGQLPLIVFQVLISLKAYLACYSNSHTL